MPYVIQDKRQKLDAVVNKLVESGVVADGDLNYILFKFAKYHVPRGYNSIKNFCGELHQCATEIERKILGPYEDEKEIQNGPIL